MINKKLDDVKYKVIKVMNNINTELTKIRELTEELNYIWVEISEINEDK